MARKKPLPAVVKIAETLLPVPETVGSASVNLPPLEGLLDRLNKNLQSDQFFRVTREYQPRNGTTTYVYRLWPVIDRRLGPLGPNSTSYIDKTAEPITDENCLLRKFGSGEYSVCFTDSNRPRGQTQICRTKLSLRHEELPPVLDLSELVLGDPLNKSYIDGLRARGVAVGGDDEENMRPADPVTAQMTEVAAEVIREHMKTKKSSGSDIPSAAIDVMADASRRAVEMAAAGNDPAKIVQMLVSLHGMFGADKHGGQAELLRLLMEQQAKNHELVLATVQSRGNPAGNGILGSVEELIKLQSLLDRMGGRRGGGSWVSELIPALPAIVGPIAQAIALAASRSHPVPLPHPQAPANASPVAVPAPAPSTPGIGVGNLIQMPSPVSHPQTDATFAFDDATLLAIGAQVAGAMSRGVSGDQFADSICSMGYEAIYDRAADAGRDAIVGELMRLPELATMFAPVRPQLEAFIDQFISYALDDDDKENEAASTTEPTAA